MDNSLSSWHWRVDWFYLFHKLHTQLIRDNLPERQHLALAFPWTKDELQKQSSKAEGNGWLSKFQVCAPRGKDVLSDTELTGGWPLQGTEGPRCPGSPLLDGARQSGNTLAHRWSHSLRGHRQTIVMICAKSVHDPFHYSFIIFWMDFLFYGCI